MPWVLTCGIHWRRAYVHEGTRVQSWVTASTRIWSTIWLTGENWTWVFVEGLSGRWENNTPPCNEIKLPISTTTQWGLYYLAVIKIHKLKSVLLHFMCNAGQNLKIASWGTFTWDFLLLPCQSCQFWIIDWLIISVQPESTIRFRTLICACVIFRIYFFLNFTEKTQRDSGKNIGFMINKIQLHFILTFSSLLLLPFPK